MKTILLTTILFALNVHADKHDHKHHKNHKAHQHGAGKVSVAFEGTKGKIEIEVPGEAIYGFEHAAKKEADQKKQTEGLQKLETEIGKMVVFPTDAKCAITKDKVEVNQVGKHADVDASFNVQCEKDLAGSELVFNIQESFPRFSKADVQVLVGDIQKSAKANKVGTKIELKK